MCVDLDVDLMCDVWFNSIREHHIPSSFQLQNFLPILALCQYKFDIKAELEDSNQQHDESLLTVHANEPSKSDREGQTQLQEFLPVIKNFFRYTGLMYNSHSDVIYHG